MTTAPMRMSSAKFSIDSIIGSNESKTSVSAADPSPVAAAAAAAQVPSIVETEFNLMSQLSNGDLDKLRRLAMVSGVQGLSRFATWAR